MERLASDPLSRTERQLDWAIEEGNLIEIFYVNKKKAKRQILEAMYETAADPHRIGFIDKRKMKQYEALCLAPISCYDSKKAARCART